MTRFKHAAWSPRCLFLAAALIAPAASAQTMYTVVDLGPLDPDVEYSNSQADGLNERGDAVGRSTTISNTLYSPTLWLHRARYGLAVGANDLGDLGQPGGRCYDVNDLGQVIGFVPGEAPQSLEAFRWDPDGGMVGLGDLGGGYSLARAINNHGWVVGESKVEDPTQYRHAFLHDGTQMIDLGTFGGVASRAYGLNDLGQVVGESWYDGPDPWGEVELRAFLWLPEPAYGLDAGLNDIDDYSAEVRQTSRANAINERGQIVGWLDTIIEQQSFTGLGLWLPEPAFGLPAGWTNLGSLVGPDQTCFARDINDHGVVVTKTKYGPGSGAWTAATWHQGIWTNLNYVISEEDQELWYLESATAINNDGIIVGDGSYEGWPRGFMLVPVGHDWCDADLDGDGTVGFGDMLHVIGAWGTLGGGADLDGDGVVGFGDVLALVGQWGPCASSITGACCFEDTGDCQELANSLCTMYGGTYHAGTDCSTFACLQPGQGACCLYPSGLCEATDAPSCDAMGGSWLADTLCQDVSCPTTPEGDTIENPFVITALPFSGVGTTAGFGDWYDEACIDPAAAAEVVYAYTPLADEVVTISLCADSDYDTKLYVYEDTHTPGAPYACNDDACESPSLPVPAISRITDLPLSAGHTYYVVIDGWGTGAGNYTLDVTVE
ncbi:MAG: hypothetical protein ACYTGP_05490 [Planctomycetota bacterium]|jgi:probable HAF family extracellular repeat protein